MIFGACFLSWLYYHFLKVIIDWSCRLQLDASMRSKSMLTFVLIVLCHCTVAKVSILLQFECGKMDTSQLGWWRSSWVFLLKFIEFSARYDISTNLWSCWPSCILYLEGCLECSVYKTTNNATFLVIRGKCLMNSCMWITYWYPLTVSDL